jgi:hypothetical protein
MSTMKEHRRSLSTVRPFDERKAAAPVRSAWPMSQRQLVEQSLWRCPPRRRNAR